MPVAPILILRRTGTQAFLSNLVKTNNLFTMTAMTDIRKEVQSVNERELQHSQTVTQSSEHRHQDKEVIIGRE